MRGPTQKQQAVLDFLRAHLAENQRMPTRREIGAHFGISLNAVESRLVPLEQKGFIARSVKGMSRGIQLTGPARTTVPSEALPTWQSLAEQAKLLGDAEIGLLWRAVAESVIARHCEWARRNGR
jgi:repressor LexA